MQLRRARLAKPKPAASSRRTSSSDQPFSPKLSSTAGSAMPCPSSAIVTVSGVSPVPAAVSPGRAAGAATEMRTRVAPALLEFCNPSEKMSARVPP